MGVIVLGLLWTIRSRYGGVSRRALSNMWQGLRGWLEPYADLSKEDLYRILEARKTIKKELDPGSVRNVKQMHIHSRMSSSSYLLIEFIIFKFEFLRRWVRWRLVRELWWKIRWSPRQLFNFFCSINIANFGVAFSAEEPYTITPRDASADELLENNLWAIVSNVEDTKFRPDTSADDFYENIFRISASEIPFVSHPSMQISFPRLEGNKEQRESFWLYFDPNGKNLREEGELKFVDKFRDAVDCFPSFIGYETEEVLNRSKSVDPEMIFLWSCLQFLVESTRQIPVYSSGRRLDRADRKLRLKYLLLWKKLQKELSQEAQVKSWYATSLHVGRFMKYAYKTTGRVECMSVRERARREFFRTYEGCATFEDDSQWESRIPSGVLSEKVSGDHRFYDVCFRRPKEDTAPIWDLCKALPSCDKMLLAKVISVVIDTQQPSSFDRVIGMDRSGVVFSTLICLVLRKPMSILQMKTSFNLSPFPSSLEKILLVDDSIQSGYSMLKASLIMKIKSLDNAPRKFSFCKYAGRTREIDDFDTVIPYVFNSDAWRKEIPAIISYRYKKADVGPLLPLLSLNRDKTDWVPENLAEQVAERIEADLQDVTILDKDKLAQKIRRICLSDYFVKSDLVFDNPLLLLEISKYFYEHFIKENKQNIDVLVSCSTLGLPIVAGIVLFSIFDSPRKKLTVLSFSGKRRILGMGGLGDPLDRKKLRIAMIDLAAKSLVTANETVDRLDEECDLSPDLFLSVVRARYYKTRFKEIEKISDSIFEVD